MQAVEEAPQIIVLYCATFPTDVLVASAMKVAKPYFKMLGTRLPVKGDVIATHCPAGSHIIELSGYIGESESATKAVSDLNLTVTSYSKGVSDYIDRHGTEFLGNWKGFLDESGATGSYYAYMYGKSLPPEEQRMFYYDHVRSAPEDFQKFETIGRAYTIKEKSMGEHAGKQAKMVGFRGPDGEPVWGLATDLGCGSGVHVSHMAMANRLGVHKANRDKPVVSISLVHYLFESDKDPSGYQHAWSVRQYIGPEFGKGVSDEFMRNVLQLGGFGPELPAPKGQRGGRPGIGFLEFVTKHAEENV